MTLLTATWFRFLAWYAHSEATALRARRRVCQEKLLDLEFAETQERAYLAALDAAIAENERNETQAQIRGRT